MTYTCASFDRDEGGSYITERMWYLNGAHNPATGKGSTFSFTVTLQPGELSKTVTLALKVKDDEGTWSTLKTQNITFTLNGRTEYYLTDHLGSVRTTIDQNGNVLGYDDYDPFGNVLPTRSSNFATPNDDNKFTGHERDTEGNLNLDYTPARIYDGETGMFYGIDALLEFASPYSYVGGNPINLVDMTGLNSTDPEKEPMMEVQGEEVVIVAQGIPATMGYSIPFGFGISGGAGIGISSTAVGIGVGLYAGYLGIQWLIQNPGAVNQNAFIPLSAQLVQQQYLNQVASPGIPTEKDGFIPKKGWDGKSKVRSNNGKYGFPAKDGSVWVPTGDGGLAHGGPHWDVQFPNGGYENVYPGGKKR